MKAAVREDQGSELRQPVPGILPRVAHSNQAAAIEGLGAAADEQPYQQTPLQY